MPNEEPDATPAAEELASEEGVNLADVEGSGVEGRITKADVAAAADDGGDGQAVNDDRASTPFEDALEADEGFIGIKVDPTPDENYTLKGVASGAPTPETDEEAFRKANANVQHVVNKFMTPDGTSVGKTP